MYEKKEKPKESKSRTVANSVVQKKGNETQNDGFMGTRLLSGLPLCDMKMSRSRQENIMQPKNGRMLSYRTGVAVKPAQLGMEDVAPLGSMLNKVVQRTVNPESLDERYNFWLSNNEAAFLSHLQKKMPELKDVKAYLQLEATTKSKVQKEMEECVKSLAKGDTKNAVTTYRGGLPEIKKSKLDRSDLLDEATLGKVGDHAVENKLKKPLADLEPGVKLYHCTKAASAIMSDQLKGGTGIKDIGSKYTIDPSLVGRISLTTDPNRTLAGTEQLAMELQDGDVQRYGIFKFGATDEYVATVPIPGNRFTNNGSVKKPKSNGSVEEHKSD